MTNTLEESPGALYEPLDKSRNEIRILEILPQNSEEEDIVHCRLFRCSLDDKPSYAALSYVWGDMRMTRSVFVNGHEVQVTTNLGDALFQLTKDGTRYLWADALCINQQDDDERGDQVRIMKEIYQTATCVLAWLGAGDEMSDRGMLKIHEVARLARSLNILNHGAPKWWKGMSARQIIDLRNAVVQAFAGTTRLEKGDIGSIVSLLKNPYWTRLWVIQEVTLAQTVYLACGSKKVPWSDVLATSAMLDWMDIGLANVPIRLRDLYHPFEPIHYPPRPALRLSTALRNHGRDLISLAKMTCDGTNLAVADPHDRMYALLGLMHEEDRTAIPIDYTKDPWEIFAAVTRRMLRQEGPATLYYSGLAYRTDEDNHIPSWVFDWTCTLPRAGGLLAYVKYTPRSRSTPYEFKSLADSRLSIQGSRLDQVTKVLPFSGGRDGLAHFSGHMREVLAKLKPEENAPMKRKLWKAILFDRRLVLLDMQLSDAEVDELFDDYLQCLPVKKETNTSRRSKSAIKTSDQSDVEESASGGTRQDYVAMHDLSTAREDKHLNLERLIKSPNPSHIFITEQGHVGSASLLTQVGDVVYAFPECQWMYLLRRGASHSEKGDWNLLSAAYVGGFTYEDIEKFWERGPLLEEVILN
jgi:hypothetical protein